MFAYTRPIFGSFYGSIDHYEQQAGLVRTSFLLEDIYTYNPYMAEVANKRIPVTGKVWEDLSDLKVSGETFAHLLSEMIENEKKRRLFLDMEKIEKEGKFVELPL
jgi:predicted CopG family antitoxin